MQPQKLCLKWNNHTVNLLSVLGSFQQKDILVDVTISCEGQNIKAHKMVLSACSPYFQNIFLENPCQHPIVIINGIKYEDITAILNFMYKGEVNVSQDGLSSFLQAAEALKVKGLAEVCGERKSTNSINQEAQHNEQSRPQRTDTPTRKKHRNRKRSLSDSNKSDDEGTARKHHREPSSPEIHELSGDESFTGDNTSNGPPFHSSTPRVPQNIYSRSHQSSSNLGGEDDDDYEVEPAKLLEQQMTTDSAVMNNTNSDNNLRIERIMGNATEIESSNIQEPESPPDIKPIIDYGESSAGPSDGNLMLYSEHSQPGPSSVQDGALLQHDNSHAQDYVMQMLLLSARLHTQNSINKHSINSCGSFKCVHCSYVTEKMINFEKHLAIHIDNRTFDCLKCGEEFAEEAELSSHPCTFTGLRIFSCEFCTKEFGFKEGLRKHIRRHTRLQSFSCNQCPLKFHDKNKLLHHIKLHNAEKKFNCLLCDKSFKEKKDLIRHMQSHTGTKPYDCAECGRKFSRKNDLMRHSRLHTGERHFNCEHCGKEFYRKDKLKIHVRIHTGEKPFTCEYCGRCFAAKTDMLRHFKLHSYDCDICCQKFPSYSDLRDHICKKSYEADVKNENSDIQTNNSDMSVVLKSSV